MLPALDSRGSFSFGRTFPLSRIRSSTVEQTPQGPGSGRLAPIDWNMNFVKTSV